MSAKPAGSRGRPAKREPSSDARHPPGRPKAPRWLNNDARAEWKRVCDLLEAAGKLTLFDLDVLISYTTTFAERNKLVKTVAKLTSRLIETERGATKIHPNIMDLRLLEAQLKDVRKELGLSPYTRERLDKPAVVSEARLKVLDFASKAKARKETTNARRG